MLISTLYAYYVCISTVLSIVIFHALKIGDMIAHDRKKCTF